MPFYLANNIIERFPYHCWLAVAFQLVQRIQNSFLLYSYQQINEWYVVAVIRSFRSFYVFRSIIPIDYNWQVVFSYQMPADQGANDPAVPSWKGCIWVKR